MSRRTEGRNIAFAEQADGLAIERRLAGGQQFDSRNRIARQLGFGIEAADGFKPAAEKIQPQRRFLPRRPQIDDATAQRIIAGLPHRAGAGVAIAGEKHDQRIAVHIITRVCEETGLCNRVFRRHTLQHGVDGGDHHGRRTVLRAARKRGQCGEAAPFQIGFRRHPVVRQAIPRRERQHLKPGIKKPQRFFDRGGVHAIGGNEQHHLLAAARGLGRKIGVIPLRRAGQRKAAVGLGDVVQSFHVGFLRLHSAFMAAKIALSCSAGTGALPCSQR